MHDFEWYDVMRAVTAVLAFVALYRLGLRASSRWDVYTSYLQDLIWVLCVLLLLLMEGNIESIVTHAPLGLKTFLGFVAAVIAFRAMMKDEGFTKLENSKLNHKQ